MTPRALPALWLEGRRGGSAAAVLKKHLVAQRAEGQAGGDGGRGRVSRSAGGLPRGTPASASKVIWHFGALPGASLHPTSLPKE